MERKRDLAAEERERVSFILLQHVYSLCGERESLVVGKIATDLALPVATAVQIVAHLTYAGFLEWEGTGRPVGISQKGTEYIERLAHRRRTLRLPVPGGNPEPEPAFTSAWERNPPG